MEKTLGFVEATTAIFHAKTEKKNTHTDIFFSGMEIRSNASSLVLVCVMIHFYERIDVVIQL